MKITLQEGVLPLRALQRQGDQYLSSHAQDSCFLGVVESFSKRLSSLAS